MPKASVRFMTGTGNTGRAAKAIAGSLSGLGWEVVVSELRKGWGVSSADQDADLFVLAFPVLGFGMPQLVRALLRGLRGRGRASAVFATWGGHHLGAVRQARAFLRRKGFRVIAAGGASYPFNWTQLFNPPTPERSAEMTRQGDAAARDFASDLNSVFHTGKPTREMDRGAEHRILSIIMGLPISLIYSTLGRFGLGAMFAADANCTACGRCVKDCPAGAIRMAGEGAARRPKWRSGCQGCNRCINQCPKSAIQCSILRAAIHLPVNIGVIVGGILGLNALSAAASLHPALSIPLWILGFILVAVYGSRLFFFVLESPLFSLESLPPFRRLISRSWTASFRRYSATAVLTDPSGNRGARTRK
jgi:ferredoxin